MQAENLQFIFNYILSLYMNYYRGFKLKVWNRLNDVKGHVAIKLPASSDLFLRWGFIYTEVPKNPFAPWTEKWKYKYLEFEIEKERIGEDLTNDDIHVKEEIPFEQEEDLFFFLNKKQFDLGDFDAPWHHNYPL